MTVASTRARTGKYGIRLWIIILPCHPFVFVASCFHNDLIDRYCLLLNSGRGNWGPLRATNQLAKIFHKKYCLQQTVFFRRWTRLLCFPANHQRTVMKFAYLNSCLAFNRLIFNFHFRGGNYEFQCYLLFRPWSYWNMFLSVTRVILFLYNDCFPGI